MIILKWRGANGLIQRYEYVNLDAPDFLGFMRYCHENNIPFSVKFKGNKT